MSKHALKTLGLSLMMALGLMAFAVGSAQAENLTPASRIHGKILILGKELKATVTGVAETTGVLLVPSLGIEISCPTFTVIEGVVNGTAAIGHGVGVVLFEGCQVFPIEKVLPFNLTSKEPLPCLPLDSVTGKDGHIRAQALLLVALHENKDYLIAEPLNLAGPLSTIKFSEKTGCPIPLKQEVTGEIAFLINTGDLHNGGVAVKQILISGGDHKLLQELFGIKLLYGINEAFIDGSANLSLTGEHKECTWDVL